jgi:hypothetical protein
MLMADLPFVWEIMGQKRPLIARPKSVSIAGFRLGAAVQPRRPMADVLALAHTRIGGFVRAFYRGLQALYR